MFMEHHNHSNICVEYMVEKAPSSRWEILIIGWFWCRGVDYWLLVQFPFWTNAEPHIAPRGLVSIAALPPLVSDCVWMGEGDCGCKVLRSLKVKKHHILLNIHWDVANEQAKILGMIKCHKKSQKYFKKENTDVRKIVKSKTRCGSICFLL